MTNLEYNSDERQSIGVRTIPRMPGIEELRKDFEEYQKELRLGKMKEKRGKGEEEEGEREEDKKVNINSNITLSDYVFTGVKGISGKEALVSKFEYPNANNKNYEDTHKFVLSNGLYVPTPAIFMPHFTNVVKAYETRNQKNPNLLLDGNENPITGKELEDIYMHLTKDHISTYSTGQNGAWTWLNARFVQGTGFNNMDLETITGIDKQGNLIVNKTPLDNCEWSDSYINLDFNSQGLAKSKFAKQEYSQGKNVYFYRPRLNFVARFIALSGRVDFVCFRGATFADPSLGVFTSTEGASATREIRSLK